MSRNNLSQSAASISKKSDHSQSNSSALPSDRDLLYMSLNGRRTIRNDLRGKIPQRSQLSEREEEVKTEIESLNSVNAAEKSEGLQRQFDAGEGDYPESEKEFFFHV
ncbi:hypothetical protein V866_007623 [Kwoniella sp. B9012]